MRMIQPVSASSPRAVFRGKKASYGSPVKGISNSTIALITAGGVASATGGLVTTLARSYTKNWSQAGGIGTCAALLAMFFMSPQIINKSAVTRLAKAKEADVLIKDETYKMAGSAKDIFRPIKKLVKFKQQP